MKQKETVPHDCSFLFHYATGGFVPGILKITFNMLI